MANTGQPLFTNKKPNYGYEFRIDEKKGSKDVLFEAPLNNSNKLTFYNDGSVKSFLTGKVKYLTGAGVYHVKVKLAGKDIEHERSINASKRFSEEILANQIGK